MSLSATKNDLKDLRLYGILKTIDYRIQEATSQNWNASELASVLVTDELNYRKSKSEEYRVKRAKFRIDADFAHFDYTASRGLTKSQVLEMESLSFMDSHLPVILLGPTGVGKTYLASAIGFTACKKGKTTLFLGMNYLSEKIALARASGEYLKLRDQLIKVDLLIIDDLGIKGLDVNVAQDLYDVLEERYRKKSTIVTTQLPLKNWKEVITDKVVLEAIMDRLIHGLILEFRGDSYRKKYKVDRKSNDIEK